MTIPVLVQPVADALLHAGGMALSMAWSVGWSLVLGFFLSAMIQAFVPTASLTALLGRGRARELPVALLAGAASSSCSYAAASVARTLLAKGATLTNSLAFLFASTNLVIELGLVLVLMMGWPFAAAEWLGGVVLVLIMALLVKLFVPAELIEEARGMARQGLIEPPPAKDQTLAQRLGSAQAWWAVAQNFAADWRMLWRDIALGFGIAGAMAAFVPDHAWRALFLQDAPPLVQALADAMIGPLVAALSFVCSIGNVPMAAVLWGSGVSFGGVLAFIYADLIVLPLLSVYRRYFGRRMAIVMAGLFYVTMVAAGLIMHAGFALLGLIPAAPVLASGMVAAMPAADGAMAHGAGGDTTFWLNLVALALSVALFALARRAPVPAASCCHHHAVPSPTTPSHGCH